MSTTFTLDRYLGRWYQYASTAHWYEPRDAHNIAADYTRRDDGVIAVRNTLSSRGKQRTIDGTLTSTATPQLFRVRLEKAVLGFAITANYAVRAVLPVTEEDTTEPYSFAIVDSRLDRATGSFYVLSRTQVPTCEQQALLRKLLVSLGYDLSRIKYGTHVC